MTEELSSPVDRSSAPARKGGAPRGLRRWKTFSPGVLWIGLLLIVIGGGICFWKVALLEMPVAPSDPVGFWSVEAEITARGQGKRGSVRLSLPPSVEGQRIYDESFAADRLPFSIRREGKLRTAVWTGTLEGTHRIVARFRVQLAEVDTPINEQAPTEVPKRIAEEYAAASAEFPSAAEEVDAVLTRLRIERDGSAASLRALAAFVVEEVNLAPSAGDDALLTLTGREGSELGKATLLVTLLRAVKIPARVVQGLWLQDKKDPEPRSWVDAYVGGSWVTLSTGGDFFAQRPMDLVVLRYGVAPVLESSGVEAASLQYVSLKERLNPQERAAVMLPASNIFAAVSLYRLPLQAQSVLQLLLLFPLGGLVLAFFRNVVGVQTYGTFMPVLLAFALRGSGIGTGLILVALVLFIGALGRVFLERLRLMIVPRLAIMLCVVVLCVTGLALVGFGSGQHDLYAGLLFPLVILTMLIERFSVTMVEEGPRSAAKGAATTTLVAVSIHPVMTSTFLGHVFFGFPELILCVIGVLVIIGGYTGYRLSDLWRFRALVGEQVKKGVTR